MTNVMHSTTNVMHSTTNVMHSTTNVMHSTTNSTIYNSISDIIFLIQTCFILLWEYLFYAMGRPIDNCVKNVSRKLGNINMFYVKAFQSISSNSQLLSRKQIEFLTSYTDNVPFGAVDIDLNFRASIAEVNSDKENKLIITPYAIPIKSGMIALIYERMYW